MTKYHYFYKITNKINNHYYYGVHNTNNLDDGYMGSGSRLHIAYEKYGIENFEKEILKFFDTSEEAFNYESEIVNENLIELDECYNIVKGGKCFDVSLKNMVVVKEKTTENYFLINKEIYAENKSKYDTTWTNRSHSEYSKDKTRKTMTPLNSTNDRIWVNKDGVVKYLQKKYLDEYKNNGWELGRKGYKPRKNSQGRLLK
jgi:hypothetical protein